MTPRGTVLCWSATRIDVPKAIMVPDRVENPLALTLPHYREEQHTAVPVASLATQSRII